MDEKEPGREPPETIRFRADDTMLSLITAITRADRSNTSDAVRKLISLGYPQYLGLRLWNDDAAAVRDEVALLTKSIQEMTAAYAGVRAEMGELLTEFRGGLANYLELKSGLEELTAELKAAREFSNTDPNLLRRLDQRMDNFEQRMGSVMYARGFAERALVYAIRSNYWATFSAAHSFPPQTFDEIADAVNDKTREIFEKDTEKALSRLAPIPPSTKEG